MTPAKLSQLMTALGKPETVVSQLCKELGVTRQTLYRHVGPQGDLREGNSMELVRKASLVQNRRD